MHIETEFLNPSDAAAWLGVSTKALRIYEQRGLLNPVRTSAGWRTYGPDHMRRAAEIVALRGLGFSLAQIGRVLNAEAGGLEEALAVHQAALEDRLRRIVDTVEQLRVLRNELAGGQTPRVADLLRVARPRAEPRVAFDLPWPWGGERFELHDLQPLTYIVGPLFSGKTKLARRLAETVPGGAFLGLERLEDGAAAAKAQLTANPILKARVDRGMAWLAEDGAAPSDALTALLVGLEVEGPESQVVDMVEQGLDVAAQQAVIAYLRRRGPDARPLFLVTRSCEILDLAAVGPREAIILCPANHGPPMHVAPCPGAPGYEAVATCLAPPSVRARTEGVIAWRPPAA